MSHLVLKDENPAVRSSKDKVLPGTSGAWGGGLGFGRRPLGEAVGPGGNNWRLVPAVVGVGAEVVGAVGVGAAGAVGTGAAGEDVPNISSRTAAVPPPPVVPSEPLPAPLAMFESRLPSDYRTPNHYAGTTQMQILF